MVRSLLLAFVLFVALAIYRIPSFISMTFGRVTLEQLLFNVSQGLTGIPQSLVEAALVHIVLKPLLVVCPIGLAVYSQSARRVTTPLVGAASALLAAVGGGTLAADLELWRALAPIAQRADWMDQYRTPQARPRARTNSIVWIQFESFESDMVGADRLRRALKKPLPRVRVHNPTGTTWTIASMFASHCGLPISTTLDNGNRFFKRGAKAKYTCISDITRAHGYENVALGGDDKAFARKDVFLRLHGFHRILGKRELAHRQLGPPPSEWWGYHDDQVLLIAREELVRLGARDKPFFLSVSTLDTHSPRGVHSPYCDARGYPASLDGAFACTATQIAEFIEWIQEQDFARHLTIVVNGDHPFMGRPRKRTYESERRDRSVFLMASASGAPKTAFVSSQINLFDLFPTVLSLSGFEVHNGEAGLGRDVTARRSLSEAIGEQELDRRLTRTSPGYRALLGE